MKNPYEVLGITSNATDDEVKRAYRNLAGIYSDNQSKMDELNQAYDTIIMSRGARNSSSGAQYAYSKPDDLGDIRAKLNSGRIDDAEMLLDGIPYQKRGAEWYFLKGTIHQRRGWLESAAEAFKRSVEIEPGNSEYKRALNSINRSRTGQFKQERRQKDNDGCCDSPCKICSSLICADCCCECLGGDLIRCC